MKTHLRCSSILVSSLLWFSLPAGFCGPNSGAITNVPSLAGNTSFYSCALNGAGKFTGCFLTDASSMHAFVCDGGILTDLGTLGGGTSFGYDINQAGQAAGQADLPGDLETHAWLCTGGLLTDLGTLGGSISSAMAVNNAGWVVGTSWLEGDYLWAAFLYDGGSMTNLGTLGGDYAAAYDVNDSGAVIGDSCLANNDVHGFLYRNWALQDLGTLGGSHSSAYAINDAGLIVGQSTTASGDTHGFVYSEGSMMDMGTLGGSYLGAFAVNRSGQAIGTSSTENDQYSHAFVFAAGVMTDLGTLGGSSSYPDAINNHGLVVGSSDTADGVTHAFLWQDGTMKDLNTLLPLDSGWELTEATCLNDSGRIIGTGTFAGLKQCFIMDLAGSNRPPVAVAGPDQTVECQTAVTLDGSQSTDPDGDAIAFEWSLGGAVLGTSQTLSVTLPLGTNVVTLKVTDPGGASAQTNVVVQVVDTVPPTGACPGDLTVPAEAGGQAAIPNLAAQVNATDNCTAPESLMIRQDPTAGTIVGLGPHPVTIYVTDASGNSASCSVTVTVADLTPPLILTSPPPVTVSANTNCLGRVPNLGHRVLAVDNCTPADRLVVSQIPRCGTLLAPGLYTIQITVADTAGNSSVVAVPLTVADTRAPTFVRVPYPITVSADAHGQAIVPNVLPLVVASDNCTPAEQLVLAQTPAAGTTVGLGRLSLTITATDAAGNTNTRRVLFTVVDTTPPVIQSVTAAPGVLSPPNHKLIPVTVSVAASDNCSPTPTSRIVSIACNERTAADDIKITGRLTARLAATNNPGGSGRIYTITIECTDASGNHSSGTVRIPVATVSNPGPGR